MAVGQPGLDEAAPGTFLGEVDHEGTGDEGAEQVGPGGREPAPGRCLQGSADGGDRQGERRKGEHDRGPAQDAEAPDQEPGEEPAHRSGTAGEPGHHERGTEERDVREGETDWRAPPAAGDGGDGQERPAEPEGSERERGDRMTAGEPVAERVVMPPVSARPCVPVQKSDWVISGHAGRARAGRECCATGPSAPSGRKIQRVLPAGETAPHFPEHLAPLLLLTSGLLLFLRAGAALALAVVVGAGELRVARGLLDLELVHGDALGFEGRLELIEAVTEQAGGLVAAGLERRGDLAVADLHRHLQRAQLRRVEADVHRPAVRQQVGAHRGYYVLVVGRREAHLRRTGKMRVRRHAGAIGGSGGGIRDDSNGSGSSRFRGLAVAGLILIRTALSTRRGDWTEDWCLGRDGGLPRNNARRWHCTPP